MSSGQIKDAFDIYTLILKSDHLKEKLPSIKDIHASNHHLLQYVVFKNYAHTLHLMGEVTDSIKYYLLCLDIDSSDPSVWLILSNLAKTNDYMVNHYACLENAFNQSLQSKIFTCLVIESICDCLIEAKDLQQAYALIQHGLKLDSNWMYGRNLKEKIIQNQFDSLG